MATDIDIAIVKGNMKKLISSLSECDRYRNVYNNGMGFAITCNFKEFGSIEDNQDNDDCDGQDYDDLVEQYRRL
jgi:Mor family transcriptional regulator